MFEDTACSIMGVMLAIIWDGGFHCIQNAWITVVGIVSDIAPQKKV
jgi:hypothetical protein